MLKTIKVKKNYNIGIEILRVIMLFWVILYHCFRTNNTNLYNIIILKRFHVPTFMFISFYYFYQLLNLKNINKIKDRLIRLLIPYILWPLIIWCFNNILYIFFHFNRYNRKLNLIDFIYQIVYGINIYGIIWFNGNLILFTIFFTIISLLFKNFIYILQITSILIYMFNYSGYIPKLICHKYFWIFLGRILGMFPIAVTSISVSSMNLFIKLKKNRNRNIFICFLNIFFLIRYDIFIIKKGYVYRSILFNLAAINLFFGFALINFEKIDKTIIIIFIKIITRYTGGIYYIHWIVMRNLKNKIGHIKNKTIQGCLIIYVLSYIICFFGIKIFGKTKLRNLFC